MRNNRIGNEKDGYQNIPFTAEENAARDLEEVDFLAMQPMNDWLQEMNQSDAEISREQEDLINHLINDHVQTVNPVIKARRDKKKEIRSRRPQY